MIQGKPEYHLGPFPAVPEYSEQFYQVVPPKDQDLMVKREFKLNDFRKDAQRLEQLYNK